MNSREYDNIIRKANQRLARAQASGFGESYEVRQLYLAKLRGSKDIVTNSKGQLQFKRSAKLTDDTWDMINKIATNSNYTVSGLKKTYKDMMDIAKGVALPQQEAIRRVMATYNEVKNNFEYKDAIETINSLGNITDDDVRMQKLKEVEEFLHKNVNKYKYADDLKEAMDKKHLFKGDLKGFQEDITKGFYND